MINFEQEERNISKLSSRLELLQLSIEREEKELEQSELIYKHTQDAREHLQHLAKGVQQKVHRQISKVVSSCLAAVFPEPYEFKIEFEMKRGKTEATLKFVDLSNSMEIDPISASGGGVVDVAAFALRCACLVLHRPPINKVLVMDESFKFVSKGRRNAVKLMLERLSKEMGIQMILTTHMSELECGKIVEL